MLGGQQDSPGGPAQTLFSASGGSCRVSKGLDPVTAPGSSHPASPPYPRHKITGLPAAGLEPRTTGPLSHPDVVAAPQCSDHRPPPALWPPGASRPIGTRSDPAGLCQPHCLQCFTPTRLHRRQHRAPVWAPKFIVLASFLPSLIQVTPFWARQSAGRGGAAMSKLAREPPQGAHGLSRKCLTLLQTAVWPPSHSLSLSLRHSGQRDP